MKREKTLTCPKCGDKFVPNEENKAVLPFCSKRCKVIDLGKWLSEKYVIEDKKPPEEEDE